VIAMAAVIPVAIATIGNPPAARHHAPQHHALRPPGPWVPPNGTAYVINSGGGTVTPIDLATSTAEKPIDVSGEPATIAIAPDGKTAYVATGFTSSRTSAQAVQPIDLATNTAGKPINLQWPPDAIVITRDGKTAYAINGFPSLTVTPINLATNTPGKSIKLSEPPQATAIASDGKAYVAIQTSTGGSDTSAWSTSSCRSTLRRASSESPSSSAESQRPSRSARTGRPPT
jgi:YVTN family beta-propeller protein